MDKIKLRRDTASNWELANPVLELGEIGIETNTGRIKVGNNSSAWLDLGFIDVVGPSFLASYTIAQTLLLNPANYINSMVMVSDVAGGPKPAYCNGVAWYYFDNNPVT